MNPRLTNKSDIFSRLGSFWTKNTAGEKTTGTPLVRALARLCDLDGAGGRCEETKNILLGNVATRYNFEYVYDIDDVVAINSTAGEVVLEEGELYDALGNVITPLTARTMQAQAHYIVILRKPISPIAIESPAVGPLVEGVSFVNRQGYLRFYGSVYDLFPDRRLFIKAARVQYNSLFDFTLKVDGTSGMLKRFSNYCRNSHSAKSLQLALNEVAGRVILDNDVHVLEIQKVGSNTILATHPMELLYDGLWDDAAYWNDGAYWND
jgi:hypothetical protein